MATRPERTRPELLFQMSGTRVNHGGLPDNVAVGQVVVRPADMGFGGGNLRSKGRIEHAKRVHGEHRAARLGGLDGGQTL